MFWRVDITVQEDDGSRQIVHVLTESEAAAKGLVASIVRDLDADPADLRIVGEVGIDWQCEDHCESKGMRQN